ncbi:MAG TPA: hypothetical protein VI893_03760, partial [Thermoplasmata archaeon]|nr:hypothetical protein [Thermoplasmata archaeon]
SDGYTMTGATTTWKLRYHQNYPINAANVIESGLADSPNTTAGDLNDRPVWVDAPGRFETNGASTADVMCGSAALALNAAAGGSQSNIVWVEVDLTPDTGTCAISSQCSTSSDATLNIFLKSEGVG